MLEVTQLNIYPVKSLQGISLQSAELGIKGLKYDRNWMIVDSDYNFLTQRNLPIMATISVSFSDNNIILKHKTISPLVIDLFKYEKQLIDVKIWNDTCKAFNQGMEASKWLTEVLGKQNEKELKLVRFNNSFIRKVDSKYLEGEESQATFSDGFPFLITTAESLELLNKKLIDNNSNPVGMERFRANVVLKGAKALEENKFETISNVKNSYSFGIRKACQRCVITTHDQITGQVVEQKEPLRTLIQINPFPEIHAAFFGQNATLLSGNGETISVGDKLESVYKK